MPKGRTVRFFEQMLADCRRLKGPLPDALKARIGEAMAKKQVDQDLAELIRGLARLDEVRAMVKPETSVPSHLLGYPLTKHEVRTRTIEMQRFVRSLHPKHLVNANKPAPRRHRKRPHWIQRPTVPSKDLQPSQPPPTAWSPGESPLELVRDSPEVIQRIEALAREKDDPYAWRDLACGYRVTRLRKPLEQAMREVGVEKIAALVNRWPGPWPPELGPWLELEARKRNTQRQKNLYFRDVEIQFPPWW